MYTKRTPCQATRTNLPALVSSTSQTAIITPAHSTTAPLLGVQLLLGTDIVESEVVVVSHQHQVFCHRVEPRHVYLRHRFRWKFDRLDERFAQKPISQLIDDRNSMYYKIK